MSTPHVSILLVTFNQRDTIARALDSILNQRCNFNFEIIVGDDCSTDGTRQICEPYSRCHPDIVRLLPRTENVGVVENYFRCFNASRGQFIADCAGDDCWGDPHRMQLQHDYLLANPQCVAVMSDWSIHNPDGSIELSSAQSRFAYMRKSLSGNEMLHRVLGSQGSFPLLSAMMYRRSALQAVYGAAPRMVCRPDWRCEDIPVLAALSSVGSFGYVSCNAYCYNASCGSVSRQVNPARQFNFYAGPARAVAELIPFYGVNPVNLRTALDNRIKYLAWLAWKSADKQCELILNQICGQWPLRLPLSVSLRRVVMPFHRLLRRATGGAG
ncbi:MAG: glycosyltransferase [Firmicutes bacterium]|nr:glycosyltransferase [Bacillota bacterium]MCM1401327.1 glycosyltransferase [Bacteroides sp.]MCM1477280.1 glycosyltransferase [Bacteroides sp.]